MPARSSDECSYHGLAGIGWALAYRYSGPSASGCVSARRSYRMPPKPAPPDPLLSSARCRHVFTSSGSCIFELDVDGRIVDANPVFCHLLGYSPRVLRGKRFSAICGSGRLDAAGAAINRLRKRGGLRDMDLPLRHKGGAWLRFSFHCLGHRAGDVALVEARFKGYGLPAPSGWPKTHVPLLPEQFEQITKRQLEATRQHRRPLSLLSIEIDSAKFVRPAGTPVSSRLRSGVALACIGQFLAADIVCRIDDRVFLVLLPDTTAREARAFAERLRSAVVRSQATLRARRFQRVTVSIGVVTTRTGRATYRVLRSRVDAKRDDATQRRGNRVNP